MSVSVALGIWHAKLTHYSILSSDMSGCIYHIFQHKLINGTIFGKKFNEHKMCFHSIYNCFMKLSTFWKYFSKISKIYIGLQVKYTFFLSDFNLTWIFWTDFLKNFKCQTWTFRNFAKVPENQNPQLKLHHKTGHKNLTGIYILSKQNILDTKSGNINEQLHCGY